MPSVIRLDTTTPVTEPVGLSLANVHARLGLRLNEAGDGPHPDATAEEGAEVAYAQHLLRAAREEAENFTGLSFAGGQRLEYTFELGEAYRIPAGATVESVTGFFDSVDAIEAFSVEEYRKGISINRELAWDYALLQTYTVTLQMPAVFTAPAVVVQAILLLFAEWYKNREVSVNGAISVATQVQWQNLLGKLRALPASFA
ncbi:hypothetical protein GCM10027048_27760 [Hymenobacter coalescens]